MQVFRVSIYRFACPHTYMRVITAAVVAVRRRAQGTPAEKREMPATIQLVPVVLVVLCHRAKGIPPVVINSWFFFLGKRCR